MEANGKTIKPSWQAAFAEWSRSLLHKSQSKPVVDTENPIRPLDACAYETCSLLLLADFAYPDFVILLLVYGSLPFSPYPCTLIHCATYRAYTLGDFETPRCFASFRRLGTTLGTGAPKAHEVLGEALSLRESLGGSTSVIPPFGHLLIQVKVADDLGSFVCYVCYRLCSFENQD
jgi:hypothetical protein